MTSLIQSHVLQVTVVEAQNITRTNEWNEGSDSFCELRLNGNTLKRNTKTSVQKKTLAPKWNESFTVELSHAPMNDILCLYLYGEKTFGKTFIGRIEIPVTLLLHGALVDGWFKLLPQVWNSHDLASKAMPGNLHLLLHYQVLQKQAPAPKIHTPVLPTPPIVAPASAQVAYPAQGNTASSPQGPMVSCPVCNKQFSALTINSHLDYCTTHPQSQAKPELEPCPVCSSLIAKPDLAIHVDACLAKQSTTITVSMPPKPATSAALHPTNELDEKAQLNAVLIASKLEAQKAGTTKEKEREQSTSTVPEEMPVPLVAPFNPLIYPPLSYMQPYGSVPPFNPAFMPQPPTSQTSSAQPSTSPTQPQPPFYPSMPYLYPLGATLPYPPQPGATATPFAPTTGAVPAHYTETKNEGLL